MNQTLKTIICLPVNAFKLMYQGILWLFKGVMGPEVYNKLYPEEKAAKERK